MQTMSRSSFLFNSNMFLSFPPIQRISSPSISSLNPRKPISHFPFPAPNRNPETAVRIRFRAPTTFIRCRKPDTETQSDVDCSGTGSDVECVAAVASSDAGTSGSDPMLPPLRPSSKSSSFELEENGGKSDLGFAYGVWDSALLVSPFFFWGTAMVAMKEVLPKAGPFFVSSFRLIPAGVMLIAFAAARGRKQPSGTAAWVWILLFGVVDAACFQGFLAEGLQRTSAGLGSVIIDSQPLTVAVLAALLFGESIGVVGAAGLVVGVIGLLLLEVPSLSFEGGNSTLWGSGEWWMLLAAQSMAVGTVMVRWVSKYSDPVMATGWHMVIGGIPLLAVSVLNHDPAVSGSLKELTSSDLLALLYTSVFGSAISYGVYFYNATRGCTLWFLHLSAFIGLSMMGYLLIMEIPIFFSFLTTMTSVDTWASAELADFFPNKPVTGSLTRLSSLTFLTPMFASIFGFIYLGETFSPVQLVGALVTVVAIYMVNYRNSIDQA